MPEPRSTLYAGGLCGLLLYFFAAQYWIVLVVSLVTLLVGYSLPTTSSEKVDPVGKAVLITGCDSGFGWLLARQLDARGFQVFAGCLLPDGEGASNLRKECSGNLHVIEMDVTSGAHVDAAVVYVRNNLVDNDLWAVVNNAGVAIVSEIEWCPIGEYQRLWDVNVLGMIRITKAFLPDVRRAKGRVVNVTSLAGRYTLTSFSAYSTSKCAAIAFTDGLRREMVKFGVKVALIEPGLYNTAISQSELLLRSCISNWDAAPGEVKDAYGDDYFRAYKDMFPGALAGRMLKDVNKLVDKMAHGVEAVHPKSRYVSTQLYLVRTLIVTSLPYWFIDGPMVKFLTPTVGFKAKAD